MASFPRLLGAAVFAANLVTPAEAHAMPDNAEPLPFGITKNTSPAEVARLVYIAAETAIRSCPGTVVLGSRKGYPRAIFQIDPAQITPEVLPAPEGLVKVGSHFSEEKLVATGVSEIACVTKKMVEVSRKAGPLGCNFDAASPEFESYGEGGHQPLMTYHLVVTCPDSANVPAAPKAPAGSPKHRKSAPVPSPSSPSPLQETPRKTYQPGSSRGRRTA